MNDTKVLLHVDTTSRVGDVINGKAYIFPCGEPVEMDAFFADAVISHIGHIYGLVEVNQTKTKTGIVWDVEEAQERAGAFLIECDKATVNFYVRQQMEDRIAGGKPALPPTGRALDVIKKNQINLKRQFGLHPVGWVDPGEDLPNTGHTVAGGDNTELLKVIKNQSETISGQQAQIADLNTKFERLMAMLNPEPPNPETQNAEAAGS